MLVGDGLCFSTSFLFEKRFCPMMQPLQNALFINHHDYTHAVIFDRGWLVAAVRAAELKVVAAIPPALRGYQWILRLAPGASPFPEVELPEDRAPFGELPPPLMPQDAERIGLQGPVNGEV